MNSEKEVSRKGEMTMTRIHDKSWLRVSILVIVFMISASLIIAQDWLPRKWNTRKVNLSFNKYYDWNEVEQALRNLEKALRHGRRLNTFYPKKEFARK